MCWYACDSVCMKTKCYSSGEYRDSLLHQPPHDADDLYSVLTLGACRWEQSTKQKRHGRWRGRRNRHWGPFRYDECECLSCACLVAVCSHWGRCRHWGVHVPPGQEDRKHQPSLTCCLDAASQSCNENARRNKNRNATSLNSPEQEVLEQPPSPLQLVSQLNPSCIVCNHLPL